MTNYAHKSLAISFFIHAFAVCVFFMLSFLSETEITQKYNFDIIEKEVVKIEKVKPQIEINAQKKVLAQEKGKIKKRKVFGVKRKTMTIAKTSSKSSSNVIAKVGNTVTKKEDNKFLRSDESDELPEPAQEFLITSMPRALKEVRPVYPSWAKEERISGSVIFEILIDKEGKVRSANLVKSLHPKLDRLAKEALMKFEFKPAYIEKAPAVVRIKYAIKFSLES